MGVGTHMVNVGRREIGDRPVNFHHKRKLCKRGEDAGSATPWSGSTRGGDESQVGGPIITCTEDCLKIILVVV